MHSQRLSLTTMTCRQVSLKFIDHHHQPLVCYLFVICVYSPPLTTRNQLWLARRSDHRCWSKGSWFPRSDQHGRWGPVFGDRKWPMMAWPMTHHDSSAPSGCWLDQSTGDGSCSALTHQCSGASLGKDLESHQSSHVSEWCRLLKKTSVFLFGAWTGVPGVLVFECLPSMGIELAICSKIFQTCVSPLNVQCSCHNRKINLQLKILNVSSHVIQLWQKSFVTCRLSFYPLADLEVKSHHFQHW